MDRDLRALSRVTLGLWPDHPWQVPTRRMAENIDTKVREVAELEGWFTAEGNDKVHEKPTAEMVDRLIATLHNYAEEVAAEEVGPNPASWAYEEEGAAEQVGPNPAPPTASATAGRQTIVVPMKSSEKRKRVKQEPETDDEGDNVGVEKNDAEENVGNEKKPRQAKDGHAPGSRGRWRKRSREDAALEEERDVKEDVWSLLPCMSTKKEVEEEKAWYAQRNEVYSGEKRVKVEETDEGVEEETDEDEYGVFTTYKQEETDEEETDEEVAADPYM